MPKPDSHLLAKILASMVCVLAAFSCAATTAGPASVQETAFMTEAASPAINDSLSAQQLHDRILAWVLSVNDARDLSAQNIERQTGLSLKIDTEGTGSFRGVGALTGSWRYSLSSVKPAPGASPHSVLFSMGHSGDRYADMTPVCVGLERYQSTLAAAGFKASQRPPRLGTEYRFFRTEKVSVRIELRGRTKLYDPQLCITRIFISAAPQG
ncbi:hypothetical protein [Lysobacter antibioticus]|uniref:hypothetical protein n=1 Tax=Lysobacter antibioticus TaxID=84531 RepID=UPI000716F989|nr:hypothetical protein [Lysobacter antibioticus]